MQQQQGSNDWTKDLLVLLMSKNHGRTHTSCAVINSHSLSWLIDRLHFGTVVHFLVFRHLHYRIFSRYRQDRCLESEMGPQIPPASIVTKVWVLGVSSSAAECSFARVGCPSLGKARSWQKTITRENTVCKKPLFKCTPKFFRLEKPA